MKHKRDDGVDKQDEETLDVTPIMICVFVVMCCSMLVLLYFFYDSLGIKKNQKKSRHDETSHEVHPNRCPFFTQCDVFLALLQQFG